MSVQRAFVTGATGGIGSALCERLCSDGWRVVALARAGSETGHIDKLPGLEIVHCDLLDEASLARLMAGSDVVFHLAAMVHEPHAREFDFQRVNVDGTRSVVGAAVAAQVPAFVFFGTVAVYPESDACVDEFSAVGPSTAYGVSKLAAEKLVLERQDSISVTVLRLPVVYGPVDRGNVRRLIAAVAKRRFVIPGSGNNVKTMVAVDNVVAATLLVASDARARGRIYIVTDEHPSTLLQIVSAISAALGQGRTPPSVPRILLAAAGRLADLLARVGGPDLPISESEVRKLASSTRYDGARIQRELGFRPPVRLEEGIVAAVDGYRRDAEKRGRRAGGRA